MKKPITRKITRLSDGAHTGWSLSVKDYERAVKVAERVLLKGGSLRAALKVIGIVAPKKAKGAK